MSISEQARKVLSRLLLITHCVINDAEPPASRMGIYYLNGVFVAAPKPTGSRRMLQLQSNEPSLLSCENNPCHLFDVDPSTAVAHRRLSAGVFHLQRPSFKRSASSCQMSIWVHTNMHRIALGSLSEPVGAWRSSGGHINHSHPVTAFYVPPPSGLAVVGGRLAGGRMEGCMYTHTHTYWDRLFA